LFREIKQRGGGLINIPRDGVRKMTFSKDGPKDHRILCQVCEDKTKWIDDAVHKPLLDHKFQLLRPYSKKQQIIGYSDHIDALALKRFVVFTVLKASWSNDDFYDKFFIEPQFINRLLPFLNYAVPSEEGLVFYLFFRHPTVSGLPKSPEVHNGRLDQTRHEFAGHTGQMVLYHFLEFTCMLFIFDNPKTPIGPNLSLQNQSRVYMLRSHSLNQKLDEVAIQFVSDRIRSESWPPIA